MRSSLIAFNIVLIILIPTFGLMLGASSMAAGILLSSLYALIFQFVKGVKKQELNSMRKLLVLVAIFAAITFLSLIGSGIHHSSVDFSRGVLSIIIFIIISFGALSFSNYLLGIDRKEISRILFKVYYVLVGIEVIGVFGYSPFYDKT